MTPLHRQQSFSTESFHYNDMDLDLLSFISSSSCPLSTLDNASSFMNDHSSSFRFLPDTEEISPFKNSTQAFQPCEMLDTKKMSENTIDPTNDAICAPVKAKKTTHKKSCKHLKVDPITGKPSDKRNAVTKSAFISKRKVDPLTGELSTRSDAIQYNTFRSRLKVDPDTGKLSTAENAIARNTYYGRKKVDPKTGKPSTAKNAIPTSIFKKIRKVDPETGRASKQPNAIPKRIYQKKMASKFQINNDLKTVSSNPHNTRSKKNTAIPLLNKTIPNQMPASECSNVQANNDQPILSDIELVLLNNVYRQPILNSIDIALVKLIYNLT